MSGRQHRRDFFRTSASAGAGLWIVGSGSDLLARSANEVVNVACVGVGGQGFGNLRNISGVKIDGKAAVNIVALCDIDDNRLNDAAKLHQKAAKYHDFRKMLDEKHKEIDAVVVSTPDHTHAVAAIAAMKLKKGVYCEKPMAHSILEARLMTETAAREKVASQMGNQGQSGENTRKIVEIVRSGAIGPVKEMHAWTNRPTWPQGMETRPETTEIPKHIHWDEWVGPASIRPHSDAYYHFKWRGWWDFGTGALGDMACHILNAAFWALDLKYPTSVVAEGEPHSAEGGPRAETIVYEFPARGDMPPARVTWYDGGRKPPKDLLPDDVKWSSGGSLLIGEKGKLYIPDDYGGRHVLLPRDQFKDFKNPAPTLKRSPGHHRDFIEAVKDPSRPASSDFSYSGPLTEMVLLGVVAFRANKKLEWDGPNMKVMNSSDADAFIRPTFRNGWSV
ncbi:MAG: Inositol 2-dehydrogenase [Planctomycetota bacterium]|nr:Inositol 2-dehydrogenase [Planctomycetota bacterium]